MSNKNLAAESTVVIKRTFATSPESAFGAWTEPSRLKEWFAPSEEMTVPIAEVDLRVGGRYRIAMSDPDPEKGDYIVSGIYKEVDAPHKIVFTWAWETHTEYKEESLVTVDFKKVDGGTEVVLTHERITVPKYRDEHNKGWTGCFARLEKHLAR